MDSARTVYDAHSLLERARAIASTLRDRAAESYEARRMPEATIDDFWNSHLFHLMRPRKFDGPAVTPDIVFQVAATLGSGDGSAAWVWNLLTMHDLFAALLPLEAQQEYWSTPRVLGASSFAANGRAAATRGGFKVTGKWAFCSGVDCCHFLLFGVKCDVPAETRWVLIPKSDCRIIDDWHVMGLCGTGSKSVAVDDAFVPEYRTVRYDDLVNGTAPGSQIHDGPVYRAPLWPVFTLGICAPAAGVARGACQSFIQEMKTRVYGADYKQQAKNPLIQIRVAEASAMVDAAELLYQRSLKHIIGKILAEEPLTVEERLRSRRDQAYSVRLSTNAVELLLSAQGGRGLYNTGPVQRAARDLHGISAHLMGGWDMPAIGYGQFILGNADSDSQEQANPFF